MYKLKHKRDIPAQITEIDGETKTTVSRDKLLNNFRSDLLVFYKEVTFQNRVPLVKMYPEAFEEIK